MKLEGTVTNVEILRGGASVGISFGTNGAIVLNKLSDEDRAGMRAGETVSMEIDILKEEPAPVEEEASGADSEEYDL